MEGVSESCKQQLVSAKVSRKRCLQLKQGNDQITYFIGDISIPEETLVDDLRRWGQEYRREKREAKLQGGFLDGSG
jgi:hypothetical protein